MKGESMKALLKKRENLMQRIAGYLEFFRGSITSVCSTCNRAACICTGKEKGRAYRLTYKDKQQKTRTVYISQAQLPEARKMIDNYAKIRKIIDELFETNIAIFKGRSKP
jgi:hypothetical protein